MMTSRVITPSNRPQQWQLKTTTAIEGSPRVLVISDLLGSLAHTHFLSSVALRAEYTAVLCSGCYQRLIPLGANSLGKSWCTSDSLPWLPHASQVPGTTLLSPSGLSQVHSVLLEVPSIPSAFRYTGAAPAPTVTFLLSLSAGYYLTDIIVSRKPLQMPSFSRYRHL